MSVVLTLRLSIALLCASFCARQCQYIRQRHTQRTPYIRILGDWFKKNYILTRKRHYCKQRNTVTTLLDLSLCYNTLQLEERDKYRQNVV